MKPPCAVIPPTASFDLLVEVGEVEPVLVATEEDDDATIEN